MKPVRIPRRGLTVDGQRLQQLRRVRGLTQAELARLAGIAVRTVRSAEAGLRIRVDFARFLATVLGVEVVDLAAERDELCVYATEDKNVVNVLQALHVYTYERDLSEYERILAPNALLRMPGPEEIPLCGEYRGIDGLRGLLEYVSENLTHEDGIDFSDIRTSGNLMVIQFQDATRYTKTGKVYRGLTQYVYEFEKGRVVRVDNTFDTHAMIDVFKED